MSLPFRTLHELTGEKYRKNLIVVWAITKVPVRFLYTLRHQNIFYLLYKEKDVNNMEQ